MSNRRPSAILRRLIGDRSAIDGNWLEIVLPSFFLNKMFGKNKKTFVYTKDTVAPLPPKQNAVIMVVMAVLGPTSSEFTLSASIFPANLSLEQLGFIIRIMSLNFGSNFYCQLCCCCLFLSTIDANTFNAYGEMMSG